MSLIDNDLLSIQEARILLEHAAESVETLDCLPMTLVESFLVRLREGLYQNAHAYAELAFDESDYGNPQEEAQLIEWVLTDVLDDVCKQTPVQKIVWDNKSAAVYLSKGVVVSLLPDWLAIPTLLSQLLYAVRSKSPIVFSARTRVHESCRRVMADVLAIARSCHYPEEALSFLQVGCPEGEDWVCSQPCVSVLIDSRENTRENPYNAYGKDVYYASLGNNPVFVESTADIDACAQEIVLGKSFCYGMLPGAEQSIVVEAQVDKQLQGALRQKGCYFLDDEEADRLGALLFMPDGKPYPELIAKSAEDLARRAAIAVPTHTKVLIVRKPYVSEQSFFSKAKYGPVLSYYVEENWRTACEKCIELILNSGHGNALSIFSNNPEVVQQFILKKPVGRVLVNVSTALGSIGSHTELPKTLTITGWDRATTSALGVTYGDFVRKRQVGVGKDMQQHDLIKRASSSDHAPTVATKTKSLSDKAHMSQDNCAESIDWFSGLLESMRDN
ncbi:aldehyde dehydrogenase family protein [Atopobium fossor]|uniref:aldehyde dehydrogenase n=1 Tax=Atopobium fossor TaxID=39487 RepID=UPI0004158617|nr:aldehyde dehydrogenase [Atopobium fossor]